MTALSPEDRRTLLCLARASVEEAVLGAGALTRATAGARITPPLRETRAAFVTLRDTHSLETDGTPKLRGCIGTLDAEEALFQSVIHNAAHAAMDDPRFPRVEAREIPGLLVEVSVLTPLRPVSGPEGIVAGRDGVELSRAGHRAVFLPQVAVEQGWDVSCLLDHLARKAGLPFGDWQGAALRTFQAEVFGEGPEREPHGNPAAGEA